MNSFIFVFFFKIKILRILTKIVIFLKSLVKNIGIRHVKGSRQAKIFTTSSNYILVAFPTDLWQKI